MKAGVGRYSDMEIPGRDRLPNAPPDWPQRLCRGSLNVLVGAAGYPDEFVSRCAGEGVKKFDSECFKSTFVIPRDAISNNKLRPTPDNLRRGDAQVWRVTLSFPRLGRCEKCWLVRRFGSGLGKQLELVAAEKLRDKLGLEENDEVEVFVNGEWAGC